MSVLQTITPEVIENCRKGDGQAFNVVYQNCSQGVFNAIYRIVKNREEAEDLLQETFISTFNSMDKYRADASIFGWIKRIGINKSLNAIKRRKLDIIASEDLIFGIEDEIEIENQWAAMKLEVNQIIAKMNLLPDGFRLVLTLYLFEDYSHKEIASELGISESTSKSQYLRGKIKLRELLLHN